MPLDRIETVGLRRTAIVGLLAVSVPVAVPVILFEGGKAAYERVRWYVRDMLETVLGVWDRDLEVLPLKVDSVTGIKEGGMVEVWDMLEEVFVVGEVRSVEGHSQGFARLQDSRIVWVNLKECRKLDNWFSRVLFEGVE